MKATVTSSQVKQGTEGHFMAYENKPIKFCNFLKGGDRMLQDAGKEMQGLWKWERESREE